MWADQSYRFRGHVAPKEGIRASVLEAALEEGVATMRLYDPIDSYGGEWGVSAKEFTDSLDALPDDVSEIRLHINSPGGEVWQGIAILNALRNHPARVVAVVDGLAASAASFIAMGADEVVMGRNSQMMIHDAWGIAIGPSATMRDVAERLDKVSDNIASTYVSKAGGTKESWRDQMLAETWYSDEEAVAAGLADRIEGDALKAKNEFDLSVFQYAGRDNAPPPLPVATEAPSEPEASTETGGSPARLRHNLSARKRGLPAA